jgi:protein arginine N-methyltransferase 1
VKNALVQAGHFGPLSYHGRLLGDPRRVAAYERAIRLIVRPGMVVLDIGAGTGILSMLAARAGARVHAVESADVAELARDLVRFNGLEDRVVVHRADLAGLAPMEPVDLVLGEYLGRFLVDDWMLPAVLAAGRWLRPGGRFCPSGVELRLAPCGGFELPVVDVFRESFYGLDLSPAVAWACNATYTAQLGPDALLSPPRQYAGFVPPGPAGPFDAELEFTFDRPGVLRALAGWFEATLAPGVTLSNGPGAESHWGQSLFPLPETRVGPGDRLRVRLRLDGDVGGAPWRWQGELVTGQGTRLFDRVSDEWAEPHPRMPSRRESSFGRARVVDAYNRGNDAFLEGRLDAAVDRYREAVAALDPDGEDLAGDLYENLALALWKLGRHAEAARTFLRVLDGDLCAREQSLRGLVSCLFRAGRPLDGERTLREYEARFGPHPEGWHRTI